MRKPKAGLAAAGRANAPRSHPVLFPQLQLLESAGVAPRWKAGRNRSTALRDGGEMSAPWPAEGVIRVDSSTRVGRASIVMTRSNARER